MAKPKRRTLPKDFEQLLSAGDVEALKAVFDHCDVDARGGVFKQSALAFNDCPEELTRWLVAKGANLCAIDSYGETPLHAHAGHWKGSVDLLIELGADVNHDAGGRGTPLHRAAAVGNRQTAEALLDHGARVDAVNASGQTPLVFALQRCANAQIERMAPMAERLLRAMSDRPQPPRSLLNRILGGKAKPEPLVTPEMQTLVLRIGTDFEFHRAGYNPESVNAASEALDRLYRLFEVPPAPRRVLNDGNSPIVARARRWEDQHDELWRRLVPSSGPAATVQGEMIRIYGRLLIEIEENGAVNWDADYRKMVDAFLEHARSGQPLPETDLKTARTASVEARAGRGGAAELCRLATVWVSLNPEPVPLPSPAYRR